ncbi:VOC family protein [Oharaeibacter diazotrophicus]|uniref:Glyoxalase-like protein n=1 Tax=Oharaeibacter diazotrophicus TaxID=1920512 RepID=A0A4R6RHG5_9HYPH|nr:VOC family protein [Oharaeibacter diazotrophicus]TDP85615.1 glyoxalase-like protein [Oharaeibacter diazotrophicus]BBE74582.1 hypothetical protein OHA_1_04215 [Pleomorphomonas sp. SM30]GLS75714.1 hypothetical protein GCM10007904_10490 [Oharaeibacter diazotrophicus]
MDLRLDHVFLFVELAEARPGGAVHDRLAAAGLVPSYERRHHGQGTANVCWCFDDAYLELLFVVDPDEIAAPATARSRLAERARWRTTGASPVGIGLRGGALPLPTWEYRFEGLPPGLSIPVAAASDDVRRPFVFVSPGTRPPVEWTDGHAGVRQVAAGWTGFAVEIDTGAAPAGDLEALVSAVPGVTLARRPAAPLNLVLTGPGGRRRRIELP